ncbi:hypothetical protein CFN78_03215 [Amycolatopsis antarctica]|uniref:Glycerophosphoryl diester phosphodiesterase membrane domain-containing protein n=2 Tax=Amycolatopsis antarctica TaxID=1854586 RepID=A0A263D9N4_9PSEU|nr:hypothetical protein CFN78_03215 [Amycolatopsis antarctica]
MTGSGGPGVIPLRPLAIGEILEGAIGTMRRHPGLVFGVSFVIVALTQLLGLLLLGTVFEDARTLPPLSAQPTPDEALAQLGASVRLLSLTMIVTIPSQTLLSGFLTVVVGKAVLGKPVKLDEVWSETRARLLPLFGLTVVYTVLVGVGVILFLVPGIWIGVLLALATPALVLERGTIGAAVTRSRLLVAGMWWRVFAVLAVALVLATVAGMVIQWPFDLLAGNGFGGAVLSTVGGTVAGAITQPFAALVTALVYLDQRMRKENMHHQLTRIAES